MTPQHSPGRQSPTTRLSRRPTVRKYSKDKHQKIRNSAAEPLISASRAQTHEESSDGDPRISLPFLLPQIGTIRAFLLVLSEYKEKLAKFLPENYLWESEAVEEKPEVDLSGNIGDDEPSKEPHDKIGHQDKSEKTLEHYSDDFFASPLVPATTRKVTEIVTTKTETKRQSPGLIFGILTGSKVTKTTTTTTTKHTEIIEQPPSKGKDQDRKTKSNSTTTLSSSLNPSNFIPHLLPHKLPTLLPKLRKPKTLPHPTTLPLSRLWSLVATASSTPQAVKKLAREIEPSFQLLLVGNFTHSAPAKKKNEFVTVQEDGKYQLIDKHVYKRLYHSSKQEWKLLEKLILGGIDEMLREHLGVDEIKIMESLCTLSQTEATSSGKYHPRMWQTEPRAVAVQEFGNVTAQAALPLPRPNAVPSSAKTDTPPVASKTSRASPRRAMADSRMRTGIELGPVGCNRYKAPQGTSRTLASLGYPANSDVEEKEVEEEQPNNGDHPKLFDGLSKSISKPAGELAMSPSLPSPTPSFASSYTPDTSNFSGCPAQGTMQTARAPTRDNVSNDVGYELDHGLHEQENENDEYEFKSTTTENGSFPGKMKVHIGSNDVIHNDQDGYDPDYYRNTMFLSLAARATRGYGRLGRSGHGR